MYSSVRPPMNKAFSLGLGSFNPSVLHTAGKKTITKSEQKIWTTTADFDGGVKSQSDDTFDFETDTDNGANTADELILANRNGDKFTCASADGLTWKWQDGGSNF